MRYVVGARQFLPIFRTPDDVRSYKRMIDPAVVSLEGVVASCPQLDQVSKKSWETFSERWRAFFASEESWFHTTAQWEQCERYEEQIASWQKLLGPKCGGLRSPQIVPDSEKPNQWSTPIVAASVAVGLVAVVVGIRMVAK
jgi:hypothetical protein